jgi:hypothetical protein
VTYIRIKISQEVLDEVEAITGTLSCNEVFYSDNGAALILADDRNYIISVSPPPVLLEGFNNGNPTTSSAYLITQPVINLPFVTNDALPELEGWTTGWEC